MVKTNRDKVVEHARKRFKAPTSKKTIEINKDTYVEKFILCPDQLYDSQIEGIKLFMRNETTTFKRITFIIENFKQ